MKIIKKLINFIIQFNHKLNKRTNLLIARKRKEEIKMKERRRTYKSKLMKPNLFKYKI